MSRSIVTEIAARAAGAGADFRAVCRYATRVLAERVGDAVAVCLLAEEGGALRSVAFHDVDGGATAPAPPTPAADGLAGHALETGRTLVLETAPGPLPCDPRPRPPAASSAMLVPLRRGPYVLGLLTLLRDHGGQPYSRAERAIAEQAAAVLGRAAEEDVEAAAAARRHERALEARLEAAAADAARRLDFAMTPRWPAMFAVSTRWRVLLANPAAAEMLGQPAPDLLGRRLEDLVDAGDIDRAVSLTGLVREGVLPGVRFRARWRSASGRVSDTTVACAAVHSPGGMPDYFVLQVDARAVPAATDRAPELVDRAALRLRVERAIAGEEPAALLLLDIDRFARVNDTSGYEGGDAALAGIAGRLTAALRPGDVVSRIGGDLFGVLVHGLSGPALDDEAARLGRVLQPPLVIGDRRHLLTASVGIAEHAGESAAELFRRADAARHRAKETGPGSVARLDAAGHLARQRAHRIEEDLADALAGDHLDLAYQPIADVATGRIVAVEALARWDHPALGPIGPAEFIPAAERACLIGRLGRWVLMAACREAAAWPGDAPPQLCVNLSPRQLRRADIVEAVTEALEASGLPAGRLCLELTESALLDAGETSEDVLPRLRELGVALALDDFGTGYSSLAYLKRFALDVLKVDRSFVSGLPADDRDRAIVGAVLALADAAGMSVIAEGVETSEQLDLLRAMGCPTAQGFHLSAPVAAAELRELIGRPLPEGA